REGRRERIRDFAARAALSVLRGSIVAMALLLSVWQSNTQDLSAPPLAPHTVSVKARPDASQQVAAPDNPRRQEVNEGSKNDWGEAAGHGPRHRPQNAGSLPATAAPPDLYAALASEWGLGASGESMASVGHAPKTELARLEPVVLIGAAPSSNS